MSSPETCSSEMGEQVEQQQMAQADRPIHREELVTLWCAPPKSHSGNVSTSYKEY